MLHDEEMDPVLRADVQRADVGMIQRGDRTGFAVESFEPDGVGPMPTVQAVPRRFNITAWVPRAQRTGERRL
jgi:hypothetical protein